MPLGFNTYDELTAYVTCLWLGIAVLLAYDTFIGDPEYIQNFYKLTNHDWDSVAEHPTFWKHFLSIATFVLIAPSLASQGLNLTPWLQRMSNHKKLVVSGTILTITMILVPIITLFHISEVSAMAFLLADAIIAAFATGVFESTCVGFCASFPHIYISAVFVGIGFSGALVTTIGIITYAALPSTLLGQQITGWIYYGVAALVNVIGLILLYLLQFNPFAHQYISEYREKYAFLGENAEETAGGSTAGEDGTMPIEDIRHREAEESNKQKPQQGKTVAAGPGEGATEYSRLTASGGGGGSGSGSGLGRNNSRLSRGDSDLSSPKGDDSGHSGGAGAGQEDHTLRRYYSATPSHLSLLEDADFQTLPPDAKKLPAPSDGGAGEANIFHVFVVSGPLVIATACAFSVTMLVYPGVLTAHETNWKWFSILVVFLYNISNTIGCISTHIQALWVPRNWVLPVAILRAAVIIPLSFFGVKPALVPGVAYPLVMAVVTGLTDGWLTTLAPVYAAENDELTTEKQRNVAGNLCDFALLLGCTLGSCWGVLVNNYVS